MRKIVNALAVLMIIITSCNKESTPSLSNIKCELSAVMPAFIDGGGVETKAAIQSVVKIRWEAGDKLVVINLTTGKQLGGCLVADQSAEATTFTPLNLHGTVSAGDKLVLFLDTKNDLVKTDESVYSPISVNLSEQGGSSDNVPIVAYADYIVTQDNVIAADNLDFHFLVSYIQLALSALPAGTSITAFEVNGVNSTCQFTIDNGEFVMEKTKGKVKLIDPFSANSKGANVRYFSIFSTSAEVSARQATITANGQEHSTAWVKAAMNEGYYYQSVATGFTNEYVEFVDDIFKTYCVSHYDLNGDGELSFAEAAAVTSYYPFTDAEKTGIEAVFELPYFPAGLGIPSFEGFVALERIALPGTLTSIPANEFKGCCSLGSIVIPDGVTSIGVGAFEGCTSLQYFNSSMATEDKQFLVSGENLLAFAPANHYYVTIPNDVRVINEGVFKNCSNIRSLLLSSTREIGNSAFEGCTSLVSLDLVNTIQSIGNKAFYGCEQLYNVYSQNATPPTIGSNAFAGCSNELKIFVSETVLSDYSATSWNTYDIRARVWNKIFYTTTDNEPLVIPEGELCGLDRDGNATNTVLSNEYVNGRGEITFVGDVYGIKDIEWQNDHYHYFQPFMGQERLRTITFPDCIRGLPDLRNNPNLETVNIPDGITGWVEFGAHFIGCTSLSQFTGNLNVSSDGLYVIHDGILYAMVLDSPSEITIPTYVSTIARGALASHNNLTKVTIMDNVKDIGLQAFRECVNVEGFFFTSMEPPVLSGDYWTFVYCDKAKIYVPFAAVDTYKTASANWDYVKDLIVGY